MPIEHVSRMMTIDELTVQIEVDRYICDKCSHRNTFHDVPMPYGCSEFDASRKGWQISIVHDEEVYCPSCVALEAPADNSDRRQEGGMVATDSTTGKPVELDISNGGRFSVVL